MIADLPLEPFHHSVERRRNVVGLRLGAIRLPRNVDGGLDACRSVEARMMLGDELEIDARGAGLEPGDGRHLVLCRLPDRVGDPDPPAGERQVHLSLPLCAPMWALIRLTWSLPPHPPAEGV